VAAEVLHGDSGGHTGAGQEKMTPAEERIVGRNRR
jgi:hypothetical protein